MTIALSILDPSPLFEGMTAHQALNDTLALAEALDTSIYRSIWVQEHHNAPAFAGTAPEVLIAALTQRTKRLSLGSGGVMLPNYSPLKVAEQFCALEALAPGRIELGIGRATGADPRTSAALLGPGADNFPTMMRLLMDWMLDASGEAPIPDDHRARGIHVGARGHRPDLWMLCSSANSAAFAGAMGAKMAYAEFLGPGGAADAVKAYHAAFEPSPFAKTPYAAIGVVAIAADTEEEARYRARPGLAWNIARATGLSIPFPSQQSAEDMIAAASNTAADAAATRSIVGSGQHVADRLRSFGEETGADEFFLLTVADGLECRLASFRALEKAWT